MKSSENRKFEEAWKEAFADAEGNVSDSVWNNIDSQLARAESGEMKKRVVFYKWLAAASVVFALAVGGGVMFLSEERSSLAEAAEDELAVSKSGEVDKDQPSFAEATEDKLAVSKSVEVDKGQPSFAEATEDKLAVGKGGEVDNRKLTVDNKLGKVGAGQKAISKNGKLNKGLLKSKNDEKEGKGDERILEEIPKEAFVAKIEEPSNEEVKSPEVKSTDEALGLNQTTVTEVMHTETILKETDTVALIESPIKIVKVEEIKSEKEKTFVKKAVEENWWAAVSGSAGSYNPNGGTATSSSLQSNVPAVGFSQGASQNNTASLGTAYSYGVNFGKRIAPRWVLISGVGFLSQSINYSSSQAIFSSSQARAFSADVNDPTKGSLSAQASAYELSSINEFISVPLQAGYLLVNKKVGVQLNAGVASDIFVRNSLVDPAGKLSTTTQTAGESSTYKTLNWTGLVGTEVSYKISSHYRISIIPGMRYSFSSIVKPTLGTVTPVIWDVGFRFRYIF